MRKYDLDAEKSVGTKFGRLTILCVMKERSKKRSILVSCLCECGKEKIVELSLLRQGALNSCGCLRAERILDNIKLAQQANKESGKIREPRLGSAARVYQVNYHDGNLTFEDFLDLSQKNCYYCGAPPANFANIYLYKNTTCQSYRAEQGTFIYNGLDRVNNTKKHDKENVVPCCSNCNYAKLDRTQEEFLAWIARVYAKHFGALSLI
jgi:hypothetical protein